MAKELENFPNINGYEWRQTCDLSWTLFSKKFVENCHSNAGAKSETDYIYLSALKIKEKLLEQKKINILEVGLGAGVSLFMTLDLFFSLQERDPGLSLFYVSLELDYNLALYCANKLAHKFLLEQDGEDFYLRGNNCQIQLIVGDARSRIKNLSATHFDVIYQDAFSPKNNPHLWTVEWFQSLISLSSPTVELSTYSASKRVQRAMLLAGFKVESRLGFAEKNYHTMAYGEKHPFIMNQKMEENLRLNPHLALQDAQLVKTSSDAI